MACMSLDMKVHDVFSDGTWMWPPKIWCKHGTLLQQFMPLLNDSVKDKIKWKCKDGSFVDFKVSSMWGNMYVDRELVPWSRLIWFSQGIPRHDFFFWLAINGKLRTRD